MSRRLEEFLKVCKAEAKTWSIEDDRAYWESLGEDLEKPWPVEDLEKPWPVEDLEQPWGGVGPVKNED